MRRCTFLLKQQKKNTKSKRQVFKFLIYCSKFLYLYIRSYIYLFISLVCKIFLFVSVAIWSQCSCNFRTDLLVVFRSYITPLQYSFSPRLPPSPGFIIAIFPVSRIFSSDPPLFFRYHHFCGGSISLFPRLPNLKITTCPCY